MKAGVITIIGESNYGNRLQNYAVEKVLRNLGIETVTINNKNDIPPKMSVKQKLELWCRYKLNHYYNYIDLRKIKFYRFNKSFLHFTQEKYPECNFPECDYFVCGSDQIWNLDFASIRNNSDFYFASFAPKQKRIAYSASIGTSSVPQEHLEIFKNGVQGMSSISVREESAVNIIKETCNRNCICTIDPTLMLDKADWLKIAKKPKRLNAKKFMLTYFLGEMSEDKKNYIKKAADYYGCKIINLHSEWEMNISEEEKNSFCFSPSEFIWLINNCQAFFTDSFHGCVFSILLDKPFRCFGRQEAGVADMSTRMTTLFGKLGVDDWCRGDTKEALEHLTYKDYSEARGNLLRERRTAYDYLKGALHINED